MSTTCGRSFASPRKLGIALDLVFFRGDEQKVHLPGFGPFSQDLVVDLDVLDVEGDVLLGLPLDLLGELGGRHHRDRDLADDHALAGDRHGAFLLPDFRVLERAAERLDDGPLVHHWPSTIVCGGNSANPSRTSSSPLRPSLRWQTLIELEPMSTPTRLFPSAISRGSVAL
jgi:hypothetical protein